MGNLFRNSSRGAHSTLTSRDIQVVQYTTFAVRFGFPAPRHIPFCATTAPRLVGAIQGAEKEYDIALRLPFCVKKEKYSRRNIHRMIRCVGPYGASYWGGWKSNIAILSVGGGLRRSIHGAHSGDCALPTLTIVPISRLRREIWAVRLFQNMRKLERGCPINTYSSRQKDLIYEDAPNRASK